MPFTVEEFRDLVRILEERPEWREELRRLVLTDELLSLPELVRALTEAQQRSEAAIVRLEQQTTLLTEAQQRSEAAIVRLTEAQQRSEARMERLEEQTTLLTEAQQRTEARVERLEEQTTLLTEAQQRTEARVERLEQQMTLLTEAQQRSEAAIVRLTEAQQRSEARMERLEQQMTLLTEAQQRTEAAIVRLTEAQQRSEARMDRLEVRMDRMADDLGELKGDALERRYRERAFAYFAPLVRRVHVVFGDELVELLAEAVEQGRLSETEADEVGQADVIVRGRRRQGDEQVYLVVEVSWGVGMTDVERAARRADLLARTGTPALPVVAGRVITEEAADLSRAMQVWQLTDGRAVSPEPE